ncbi:MAG: ATP-binding cassette domain-containing protein [Kofleriaceae bacterium]
MNAIEATHLSKRYGRTQALRDVSFTIGGGEVIGLLGPNGAGKTTLMKILTGYLEPDEGDASIHGLDVIGDPLAAQAHVGYLPESAPLYGEMLVQEYLDTMAALRGVGPGERKDAIVAAVRATGLLDRLVQPISTLSKGYRQRVGIAQAIIHTPDVLILDEPTTGLDPTQIAEIRDLIKRLAEKSTVLLSTHILSEVEATCERVLVIMQGALRADAKLADLRAVNAAVVAIEESAEGVEKLLGEVAGVSAVTPEGREGGMQRWRVTSDGADDLCPLLFEALRAQTWKVGELRRDAKTLEHVFRDLAQAPLEVAP